MMAMQDYYQILGLERSASQRQIKHAYRELCKQYHPDRNKSPEANVRMPELNEAYRVLSSPIKRGEYDQLLRLRQQQAEFNAGEAAASVHAGHCRCEKCGRVDSTLRVTVFTWVVSLLVVSYRRGWPKILCARCRTKYALLFDLQNFFMGWWGIPFGIFWTLQALWHNSMGGQQPAENNALFLAGLGYEFHRKGNLKAAASALKASLRFKKDPRVEAFYWQTQARFHETPAAYTRDPRLSLWQRVTTGAFHPAVYCAPMLAVLFCLASLWLGSENKPPVRARSVPARLGSGTIEEEKVMAFDPFRDGGATPLRSDPIREKAVKEETSDAQAQYELGATFYYGIHGVTQDSVEAVKWFRKAAEQNCAPAQRTLGYCYHNGQGVAQDHVEAVRWVRKAAEQNDALAQFSLGLSYHDGQGVAQDYVEAVKWFRKAAEQNNADAQQKLGFCYDNGQGVAQDYVEAVKWYRKAAEQNNAYAQFNLAACYYEGQGVAQDHAEAVKWVRKAAEQNLANAQYNLGASYDKGQGVAQDYVEAVKWYRKAAEQNITYAQFNLGFCYEHGQGLAKDEVEAVKWYRKAAEQNYAKAQHNLGVCYAQGDGVRKDYVEAYKWTLLAAARGSKESKRNATSLENVMTPEQIAEGQQLARTFTPREVPTTGSESSAARIAQTRPESSGTGFFITEEGYLVTNEHVIGSSTQVRLVSQAGLLSATVVKVDAANDLALLKAQGRFARLPVTTSRTVRLGSSVATVGFPNIGMQGFSPKLAKGEIASLSGAQDDPRYFQISVAVQPGNSGGALVDERGNVVGVVSAKLSAGAVLAATGELPENVNYAVKSSLLLSFLESVPEVSARLRSPTTKDRKFEDVVKDAEQAAALVLVY
jgi:TPR repeat protein